MKNVYYGIGYLLLMASFVAICFCFYLVYKAGFSLYLTLFIFNYFFGILLAFIIFVRERHNAVKNSWFFILFLFPIIGGIVYIVFGQRYKNRKSKDMYFMKSTFALEETQNNNGDNGDNGDELLKKHSLMSHRGIYGSDAKVFHLGDDGFVELFKDLKKAKKTIFLQYYIIKPGEIYEHFKQILLEKAKEGVEIKFIVDDFGRWGMPWYEIRNLRRGGVNVGIYGFVKFPFVGSNNTYRTHHKMAIIDGEIVHVGGVNIADDYAHLNKKYGLWLDYQLCLRGPIVKSFILLFIEMWKIVTKDEINYATCPCMVKKDLPLANQMVLLEDSPENNSSVLQDSFVSMVLSAKKSIKVVTPYLVLTPELKTALRVASAAGVEVTIYIPGKADKKIVFLATELNALELKEFNINVLETKNILIHSKFGIFDDEYVYFGTPNWDFRSFYSQFEFIVIAKGTIVSDLNELIKYYDNFAIPFDNNRLSKNIVSRKLRVAFVNLFSPMM